MSDPFEGIQERAALRYVQTRAVVTAMRHSANRRAEVYALTGALLATFAALVLS